MKNRNFRVIFYFFNIRRIIFNCLNNWKIYSVHTHTHTIISTHKSFWEFRTRRARAYKIITSCSVSRRGRANGVHSNSMISHNTTDRNNNNNNNLSSILTFVAVLKNIRRRKKIYKKTLCVNCKTELKKKIRFFARLCKKQKKKKKRVKTGGFFFINIYFVTSPADVLNFRSSTRPRGHLTHASLRYKLSYTLRPDPLRFRRHFFFHTTFMETQTKTGR